MVITDEQLEKLGRIVEKLDNLEQSMQLPVSAQIHLSCMKKEIPEISTIIKTIYTEISGENPWEY